MTNNPDFTDLLRTQFQELSGRRADGRWSVDKLKEQVEQLILENEKREAEVAERQAKKERIKAEQEARIVARGSVENFIEKCRSDNFSESDRKFAYFLRRATSTIKEEKVAIENFAKEMQENATYALSWSKGLFELTAKARVAREMIYWFQRGRTYEGWIEYAQSEAFRMTRSPAMSTSPTSNLMETYIAAAWASVAQGDRW